MTLIFLYQSLHAGCEEHNQVELNNGLFQCYAQVFKSMKNYLKWIVLAFGAWAWLIT